MAAERWHDIGPADEYRKRPLTHIGIDGVSIAVAFKDGELSAVSGECNHAKGPLGKGRLDGDYIVCPWHGWQYHRKEGRGHPPYIKACLPRHRLKEEGGRLYVNLKPENEREFEDHPKHPLDREPAREAGPVRIVGISTTAMDKTNPRYSTSKDLLEAALAHAAEKLGAETRLIDLNTLNFRACGGFYSIDEHACTWPCSWTQMDPKDQLDKVYEALVFWADVVLIATPVRWGSASSLYYKMAERLNCIENQTLIAGRELIKDKVAGFIITGGQDNVQAVAGQMLMFFGSLGFRLPQFPFIGTSRGWYAEDMENNTEYVKGNADLREEARGLAERAVKLARSLVGK